MAGGTEITGPLNLPSEVHSMNISSESMNSLPSVYLLSRSFSFVLRPLVFRASGSCCVVIKSQSLQWTASRNLIFFHEDRWVKDINARPDCISSIMTLHIVDARSPVYSHSWTNLHIWQVLDVHKIGLLLCNSHIELRLRLRLSWGWYWHWGWFEAKIEMSLSWSLFEIELSCGWD